MFVEFMRLFLINTFEKRQVNPFYTMVFSLLMTFEPTSLGGLSAQQQKSIMGQSATTLHNTQLLFTKLFKSKVIHSFELT